MELEDYRSNFIGLKKMGEIRVKLYVIGVSGQINTFSKKIFNKIDKYFPVSYIDTPVLQDLEVKNFHQDTFTEFGKYESMYQFQVLIKNYKFNYIPKGVFRHLNPRALLF